MPKYMGYREYIEWKLWAIKYYCLKPYQKYRDWKIRQKLKKNPELKKELDQAMDRVDRFLAWGDNEPQDKDKIPYNNIKEVKEK